MKLLVLSIAVALFASSSLTCADTQAPSTSATSTDVARWYSADAVARGKPIFRQHCASCHGATAQGSSTWRNKGADGKFPPPPLNGTAHAWHHPLRALGYQIKFGAPGGSGAMPGFADTLSDNQIIDVIAWMQSQWSDEIYLAWRDIEVRSRANSQ